VEWSRRRGAPICPAFVFSDRQIDPGRNPYFSPAAYSYMRGALRELRDELGGGLWVYRVRDGRPDTDLLEAMHPRPSAVFFNRDVTPFARDRDAGIEGWCTERGVHFDAGVDGEGYTLWRPGAVLTAAGTVPRVFSVFLARVGAAPAPVPAPGGGLRTAAVSAPRRFLATGLPPVVDIHVPGHAVSMAALERGDFDSYGDTRDDYNTPTTAISAALKFGRVSARAFWRAVSFRRVHALLRQIVWREYYYHLAWAYPHVLSGESNSHIRPDRQRKQWPRPDARKLRSWIEGRTGDPLVDASMAVLRETGHLHNRLRMVVASYLTKDLGIDWRAGEAAMATMLVDYDPCQNSGGWQSVDAQVPGREIKSTAQMRKYGPVTRIHTRTRDLLLHAVGDAPAR